MDRQSGTLKSGGGVKKSGEANVYGGSSFNSSTTKGNNEHFEPDVGGASRFFYQAPSLDDLESYLVRLIGNDPTFGDQGEE